VLTTPTSFPVAPASLTECLYFKSYEGGMAYVLQVMRLWPLVGQFLCKRTRPLLILCCLVFHYPSVPPLPDLLASAWSATRPPPICTLTHRPRPHILHPPRSRHPKRVPRAGETRQESAWRPRPLGRPRTPCSPPDLPRCSPDVPSARVHAHPLHPPPSHLRRCLGRFVVGRRRLSLHWETQLPSSMSELAAASTSPPCATSACVATSSCHQHTDTCIHTRARTYTHAHTHTRTHTVTDNATNERRPTPKR
jgi:hypothetical protein